MSDEVVQWVVTVNGEEYAYNFDEELTAPIDPKRAAGIAALLACARSQLERVDSEYRAWKAGYMLQQSDKRSVKPLPEWKARARAEASEDFQTYKTAVAVAGESVGILEALVFGMAATMAPGAGPPIPSLPSSSVIPVGRKD